MFHQFKIASYYRIDKILKHSRIFNFNIPEIIKLFMYNQIFYKKI